jgi:hypothetical protein
VHFDVMGVRYRCPRSSPPAGLLCRLLCANRRPLLPHTASSLIPLLAPKDGAALCVAVRWSVTAVDSSMSATGGTVALRAAQKMERLQHALASMERTQVVAGIHDTASKEAIIMDGCIKAHAARSPAYVYYLAHEGAPPVVFFSIAHRARGDLRLTDPFALFPSSAPVGSIVQRLTLSLESDLPLHAHRYELYFVGTCTSRSVS